MDIKIIATGSTGNCYLIESKGTKLMVECGIPIKKIREGVNFRLSDISGCLISHEHKDHCHAVNDLIKYGVTCYASNGTIDKLQSFCVPLLPIQKIGVFSIKPFPIAHDAAEPVGFLISDGTEKLLYISDTCRIDYQFNVINYLMIECNYDQISDNCAYRDRLVTSHLSLSDVIDFIKRIDLSHIKKIILLHMSAYNSDADKMLEEVQKKTGKEVIIA
jgi:phosphoribosyl 1,2-cyclic phosphodiesterase